MSTPSGPQAARADTIPTGITPRPGARLGPYRLCRDIGSGGMATVFLASAQRCADIHRFVALKCLKPALARQPDFAAMFLDEVRIASQIHHPHVCRVLDFDESDGVSYMVMEYLAGESLSSVRFRLAEQLAEWEPAAHAGLVARIIADASEGLHAAHELVDSSGEPANLVHRDISPDNVMLTYDGCVKILDFGVSISCHRQERTRTGVVKGKFSYLPPEVLKGERPDRRSDVWGLGVVAWELLTGQRLFKGASDAETLRAIGDKRIPAPSRLRRGLPVAIDKIVLKALQRDPDCRYATARELGRQLSRFLANRRMVVGMAELAEGLDRLFPGGRAAKRQQLQEAEQEDEVSVVVPVDTCEIMIEKEVRRLPSLGAVAQCAKSVLRARQIRLPVVAAAAVACLLTIGWSSSRHAADPPAAPAKVVPHRVNSGGLTFRVSPVEAMGDTLLLRIQMVPEGEPAVPPKPGPDAALHARAAHQSAVAH